MDKYVSEAGEFFPNFIRRIQKLLWTTNQTYAICEFNGIDITVNHDSNINDLGVIYDLKRILQKQIKV